MAEAASLTTSFAISSCSKLTADGVLKKTRPTGCVPMQTQQKKKSKRSGSYAFKETTLFMTYYQDVSAPLRHLKALFEIKLSFTPLLHVLYAQRQSFAVFTFGSFRLSLKRKKKKKNLGWAPQHGDQ